MLYEYGVTDFGSGEDCPDGPDGCGGDFDSEVTAASAADVARLSVTDCHAASSSRRNLRASIALNARRGNESDERVLARGRRQRPTAAAASAMTRWTTGKPCRVC